MTQTVTAAVDYGQLFNQAPAGYIVADTDGAILAANATMCAWTGVPAGGLDGTRLLDLMPAGDRLMYRTHAGPKLERDGHLGELSIELPGTGRAAEAGPAVGHADRGRDGAEGSDDLFRCPRAAPV